MSSFVYLKHLPVNFLKIEGGFVRDIIQDSIDCAMVESINNIGHMMGVQTIVEFVEDEQTWSCCAKWVWIVRRVMSCKSQ